MLHSPYFARIDFQEQGTSVVEAIYIGISSLLDPAGNPLIYDWRAPVSSMFYDYELGPARYLCEAGEINGEIFRKRQYKIENGRLVYMFDCNLKIDDEILQEILSKHSDEKMRAIVTSILREQNRVIRDDEHPVLLVEGRPEAENLYRLAPGGLLSIRNGTDYQQKHSHLLSKQSICRLYLQCPPRIRRRDGTVHHFPGFGRAFLPAGLFVEDRHNQLEFVLTSNGVLMTFYGRKIYLQTTPRFYS